MILKIGLVLFTVFAVSLIFAYFSKSEMHITRELLIKAPAESIFPFLNNTKAADQWMPWQEIDPKVVMTYEGPSEGLGSTSKWTSEGQMGVGQAVIVESILNKSVKTKLNYTKPMQMEQLAELSLVPTQEGTMTRWSVTGKNNFVGRLACIFINMDKVVGENFEMGLQKLKRLAESPSEKKTH